MKINKKISKSLFIGSVCLFAAGCSTVKLETKPLNVGSVPVQHVVNTATDERSLIKVDVISTTGSILETKLCDNAQAFLANNNYVVTKESADLNLSLTASDSVYDKAGEYVILDSTLSCCVTDKEKTTILAKLPEVSFRSSRKLGEDSARKENITKMSKALNQWLTDSVSPKKLGIESRDLTIFLGKTQKNNESEYITSLVTKVKALDGVLDAKLVKHNVKDRFFVINVVLKSTEFPEGLANKLIVTYPELNLANK